MQLNKKILYNNINSNHYIKISSCKSKDTTNNNLYYYTSNNYFYVPSLVYLHGWYIYLFFLISILEGKFNRGKDDNYISLLILIYLLF